jgi:hypothetical protein
MVESISFLLGGDNPASIPLANQDTVRTIGDQAATTGELQ